jgi:transposase-like protein
MKTQLSKPAGSKARYTEEYKKEALELWGNSGRSAAKVAAELGIRAPLLYRWAWPTSSTSAARSGGEVRDGEDVIASTRTRSPEIFISFKVS